MKLDYSESSRIMRNRHKRRPSSESETFPFPPQIGRSNYPFDGNNQNRLAISKTILHSTSTEEDEVIVGEDAAKFELSQQSISNWSLFGVLVSLVLASIYFVWIDQSTPYVGLGLGKDYLDWVSNLSSMLLPTQYNPEGTMALLVSILHYLEEEDYLFS